MKKKILHGTLHCLLNDYQHNRQKIWTFCQDFMYQGTLIQNKLSAFFKTKSETALEGEIQLLLQCISECDAWWYNFSDTSNVRDMGFPAVPEQCWICSKITGRVPGARLSSSSGLLSWLPLASKNVHVTTYSFDPETKWLPLQVPKWPQKM